MRKYGLFVLLLAAACGEPTAPPRPDPVRSDTVEARALWVSRFEYASASDVQRIIADARRANFNIVYLQVRGNSDALYFSNVDPCSTRLCPNLGGTPTWDPLGTAVAAALGGNLQVHAWINAFIAWNNQCSALQPSPAGNPNHLLIDHPDWIMVDSLGVAMECNVNYPDGNGWVSPGIPGVRTHLARVAADIARRYPTVAGVHLDFIRYPGLKWSWDSVSLATFGLDPKTNRAAWDQFRRDQVAAAVQETHDSLTAARPKAVLSAAVWGIWKNTAWSGVSQGYSQYFQDPRDWMNNDRSLDVAVPMTYWSIKSGYCDRLDWLCLLDDHVAGFKPSGRHVYIGMNAELGADEMIKQIERGRDRGAQGFSVFSYGSAKSTGLFDRLADGVFRLPARIPTMGWK